MESGFFGFPVGPLFQQPRGRVHVPYSPVINLDVSQGHVFVVATLFGNVTLSNPTGGAFDGQQFTIHWEQDAVGSRLLTLGNQFNYGTDITAATLTTTANKRDKQMYEYRAAAQKWDLVSFIKGF